MTALIGENGTGKSTVVEACDLLRMVPDPNFFHLVHQHGGLTALRHAAPRLLLGAKVAGTL